MTETATAFPSPDGDQKKRLGKMHVIYLEALRHREQEFLKYAVILVSAIGVFFYVLFDFNWSVSGETKRQEIDTTVVATEQGHRTETRVTTTSPAPDQSAEVRPESAVPESPMVQPLPAPSASTGEPGEQAHIRADTERQTRSHTKSIEDTRSTIVDFELRENAKSIVSVVSGSALFLGAVYCLALGYNYRYLTLQLTKIECALGVSPYMLKKWPNTPEKFVGKRALHEIRRLYLRPPDIIGVFFCACIGGILLIAITAVLFVSSSLWYRLIAGGCHLVLVIACLLLPFRYGNKFLALCRAEGYWYQPEVNSSDDPV